jgi:hypothetical protein
MDGGIYFGRVGQTRRLYDPLGGLLATRDISSSVFATGGGGARVNKAYSGYRVYSLNYGALGRDSFDWLNNFQQGHMGQGPFVLLDPGRRNLLTVNQSSGTSAANDTREFTVSGVGGTIASDASLVTPMPRTLRWSFGTSTPASALLSLDKPSSVWPGIPVVSRPYTFWCLVVGGPIDLQIQVQWLDLAGTSVVTTALSAVVTPSTTNWKMMRVTSTPPTNAYWGLCQVVPTVATITAGESLWFSSFMLNEGDNPDPQWVGGTGVYPVQILSLPERYGFAEPGMLVSPTMVLQEVK